MPDWSKLFEQFVNLAPLPLFVLATCCGALLFGSDSFLARLGVLDFRNAHRAWFGVGFLVSAVYLLGHVGRYSFQRYSKARNAAKAKLAVMKRLARLTPDEAGVLKLYVVQQTRGVRLLMNDPVVLGLESAGIIFKPAQVAMSSYNRYRGEVEFWAVFNIADWAWDALTKHSEPTVKEAELPRT
jgi:hypothetical protein